MAGFRYNLFASSQPAILPSLLTQAQAASAQNYGLLGYKTGANFNSTSDQAISINAGSYVISKIIITNASLNMNTAQGSIYTAASKAGTSLLKNGATHVFTDLTAATVAQINVESDGTLLDATTVKTAATLYLSLTTAQGAAATADVYVFGERFS